MLEHFSKFLTISIPYYLREVETSKKQLPKYFEYKDGNIKAKNKPLWKKLINPKYHTEVGNGSSRRVSPDQLADGFTIGVFYGSKCCYMYNKTTKTLVIVPNITKTDYKKKPKKVVIHEDTLERVIANPTQAGKPNTNVITGQKGYYGIHTQNLIVSKLMESYLNKFKRLRPIDIESIISKFNKFQPIWIILEIQDTVKAWNDNSKDNIGRPWDVDNRALPYLKTFKDFLVRGYTDENGNILQQPVLEDDHRLIVMGDASIFTPIDELEVRCLKFHFYQDERQIWENYKQ